MESLSSSPLEFSDYFLQPLVKERPSYIRDLGHVIKLMKNDKWESSYLWVSLDVASLYTSTPHKIDLEALKHSLSLDVYLQPLQMSFLIDLARFLLHPTIFHFSGILSYRSAARQWEPVLPLVMEIYLCATGNLVSSGPTIIFLRIYFLRSLFGKVSLIV